MARSSTSRLYPLGWFDTFAAIARVLLPLYAVLLALAFWMMWKSAQRLGAGPPVFVPLLREHVPVLSVCCRRTCSVSSKSS